MAFEWTEDISIGGQIDTVDLVEIRTNVDTVNDEKCAAHKVSYKLDYKDGDDTSYNPGYCSGQVSTYYDGHLSIYDDFDYPGYQSINHSTYTPKYP